MASHIEATFVFIPAVTIYIRRALETLYEHTPINFRVVVVDQTREGIYDKVSDLTDLYLRAKRTNLGFSKANNEGVLHGLHWGSKYIVACNDDVEFLGGSKGIPTWWEGILAQFKEYPEMMAVNPASVIEPGWGYGIGQPNFQCPDWGIAVEKNIYPKKEDGTPFTYEEAITKEGYDWLTTKYKKGHIEGFAGWCVVGKREMWEKVGLYNEKFYWGGGEDYDLNHRIYLAGGRASATMRSWVWHHWSKSKEMRDKMNSEVPPLTRPMFQNVDSLYERSEDGVNSPIYPPRGNEPCENKRKLKSMGIFVDDIR